MIDLSNIDIEKKLDEIIVWMNEYAKKTNCRGVVLGLSGGKDSTVVAMLCQMVFGSNLVALLMPNGEQKDITDSVEIAETLGLNHKIVNIETAYDLVGCVIENRFIKDYGWQDNCDKLTDKAKTNIPPRIRMTTLYAVAQTLGYRVVGTGNRSEAYVGWFTKWGDGANDFNPIAHLTCSEVKALGRVLAGRLGLGNDFVERFIDKPPADGLTGKTDEDNLGFTYDELDNYILNGVRGENVDKIEYMHFISEHKRRMPYTIKDEF